MRSSLGATMATVAVLLAACSSSPQPTRADPVAGAGTQPAVAAADPRHAAPGEGFHLGHFGHRADTPASAPLRAHERFLDLAMAKPYTPTAPTYGTDDYRCFLLDPGLTKPGFVTGVNVVPGRVAMVHHVIVFRVEPGDVAAAEQHDAAEDGEGWTCFGGTGLESGFGDGLDGTSWLGAWAPGGGESMLASDIGIPMDAGSQVIMQVHYNLLGRTGKDISRARLRMAPGGADLSPLQTTLLPAPVELPCRPGHTEPLCDRDAAVADVVGRFGTQAGQIVAGLQFFCGGNLVQPQPSAVQSCDRHVSEAGTIRAVAGHMHLLGRSIKIELNPGEPASRTLLRIHPWDFDDQAAVPLDPPARVEPGDVLRVTCRHDQDLRDVLPAFIGQPERYVVWGEGTTDEMCLGVVLLTRD